MSRLSQFKAAIRSTAHRFGVDVHRYRNELSALAAFNFEPIIDVGANAGQFYRRVRRVAPRATVHCFEPVPAAFQLLERAISEDQRAQAWQLALGDSPRQVTMHAGDFTAASSLLHKTATHMTAWPHAQRSSPITVELTTLDAWVEGMQLTEPIMLKLDVEGYEGQVLRGATEFLRHVTAVWIEVSFVELYEGQLLFADIHDALRTHGFACAGFSGGGVEERTGQMLYGDAFFVRVGSHPCTRKPAARGEHVN